MKKARKKHKTRSRVPPSETSKDVKNKITSRKLHQEREFKKTTKFVFYKQAIRQKLGKLMEEKQNVNVEFVRQYYIQHIIYHGRVDLRGQKILINADAINHFYKLPKVSDDQCMYQKLTTNKDEFPYEAIAKELVIEGEDAWFVRFSQKKYLARCDLTPKAKYWLHLVANNINPTTHLTFISSKLALLIFLLKTSQPVNIGNIMYNTLYKCREKHYKSLIFPHFITKFFLEANIKELPEDPLIAPTRPFTYTNLGSQKHLELRKTKRARHEEPHSTLASQLDALTGRIDKLENTLCTAIRKLTSLVTRLAFHQGLPMDVLELPSPDVYEPPAAAAKKDHAQRHYHREETENEDGAQQDEGDTDEIRSTDAEVSSSDDEEMGEMGSSSRKAPTEHSDSDYEPSDDDD